MGQDNSKGGQEEEEEELALPAGLRAAIHFLRKNDPLHVNCLLSGLGLKAEHMEALAKALGANHHLQNLVLSGNPDIGDVGLQLLCKGIKANQSLKRLWLAGIGVTADSMEDLCDALTSHPNLEKLSLEENPIGDQGLGIICSAAPLRSLTQLNLLNTGITVEGLNNLARLLEGLTSLQHLDLSGNKIGNDGLKIVCAALPSTLTFLSVFDIGFTLDGLPALTKVVQEHDLLQSLNLGGNTLGDGGMRLLCEALECKQICRRLWLNNAGLSATSVKMLCCTLLLFDSFDSLNVGGNSNVSGQSAEHLGALQVCFPAMELKCEVDTRKPYTEGHWLQRLLRNDPDCTELRPNQWSGMETFQCCLLSKALATNSALQTLILEAVNINLAKLRLLCKGIKTNRSLRQLWIARAGLEAQSMNALCSALAGHSTLETLSLSGMHIGDEGVEIFCAMKPAPQLKGLWLNGIGMTENGLKCLSAALREHRRLLALSLDENHIGNEGLAMLCTAIPTTLQTLSLAAIGISADGLGPLAQLLQRNEQIDMLNLGRNTIGDDAIGSLCQALECTKTCRRLWLDNTGLTDRGVEMLFYSLVQFDDFKSLHVADNEGITEQWHSCLSALTVCFSLDVDVRLSWLDHQQLSKLRALHANDPELTELRLRGEVGIPFLAAVGKALAANTRLQALSFDGAPIPNACLSLLCQGIKGNQSLRQLEISNAGLTAHSMVGLCDALAGHTTVHTLKLSGNKIGDEGTHILCGMEPAPRLTELWLADIGMTVASMKHLTAALHDQQELQTLCLDGNHIGNEALAMLCTAIPASVKILRLAEIGVTTVGLPPLVGILQRHRRMRVLLLSRNTIGGNGLEMLCSCLPASLHTLGVTFATEGSAALCQVLAQHDQLETLLLDGNAFDDQACKHLCQALASSKNCRKLWLNETGITDEVMKILCSSLMKFDGFNLLK